LATASICLAQEPTAANLIEAGHWKRARALVEPRLREAPDDPEANYLSSQISNAFGDRSSPPGLAEKAVRLNGRVARYHRQLAEVQGVMAQHAGVFQQVGLARRFRKEIDAALELDPRDVQAMRDLLEFYLLPPGLNGGDSKKAEALARQIAAVDAAEGFLAEARIAAFHKNDARSESMLRAATEVHPVSYKALMELAQHYLKPAQRNDRAAEALAENALALDKGRSGAYCVLASVYAGREHWTALEALLALAAHEVPDDYAPYYRAAERLLADGREAARADRFLRIYLRHDAEGNQPTAADAHWKLGLALSAMEQHDAAVREWKVAVQLNPESPAAREVKRTRNARTSGGSRAARSGGEN